MSRPNVKSSWVRSRFLAGVVGAGLVLSIKFIKVLYPKHNLPALLRYRGSRVNYFVSPASSFGSPPTQRLAVVVPAHAGDLYRALASLSRWPSTCSPVTQAQVDLVLYKAETEDDLSYGALRLLENTAGRCFANTKIVYGALTKEVRKTMQGRSLCMGRPCTVCMYVVTEKGSP